jgi:hypothetical protein
MQSGEITFGVKYLPDEPASTDAVSFIAILFLQLKLVFRIRIHWELDPERGKPSIGYTWLCYPVLRIQVRDLMLSRNPEPG